MEKLSSYTVFDTPLSPENRMDETFGACALQVQQQCMLRYVLGSTVVRAGQWTMDNDDSVCSVIGMTVLLFDERYIILSNEPLLCQ